MGGRESRRSRGVITIPTPWYHLQTRSQDLYLPRTVSVCDQMPVYVRPDAVGRLLGGRVDS